MRRLLAGMLVPMLVFFTLSNTFASPQTSDRPRKAPSKIIPSASRPLPAAADQLRSLPFFDDFENGAGSWTATSMFNLIQNAQNHQVMNPEINPTLVILPDNGNLPSAYSGSSMWWFGEAATGTFLGSNFQNVMQDPLNGGTSDSTIYGELVSPPIDLTGISSAQLNFKTWWEIEGVDVDMYDMMYVEISTDNGLYFESLGHGSINPLNDVDGESWKPYSSGGLGEPGQWLNQLFDLSAYTGNIVHIRFRFSTEDELYNGFRGWFIDDFSVTADPLPGPQINSLNPTTVYPGELVHISGTNFINGASVLVGDTAVAAIISTNLIVFEVPGLMTGSYDVTVTNPDGQAATLTNGLTITYDFPPEVYLIYPDSMAMGDTSTVEIQGYNFQNGCVAEIGGLPLENQELEDNDIIRGKVPSGLTPGNYNIRVTNPDGQFDRMILAFHLYSTTGINTATTAIPEAFQLKQNYPNPFNPATTIEFDLPQASSIKLMVYNILGQPVAELLNGRLQAGTHQVRFNARNLNSGIYYYELTAGNYKSTRKFILMK
ncbi:MAG: IPT/TIG domain-containing protein [Calditrichia bacterium]